MIIELITAYSGTDYDTDDLSWDGDVAVDGWLGLAPNANARYNILQRL